MAHFSGGQENSTDSTSVTSCSTDAGCTMEGCDSNPSSRPSAAPKQAQRSQRLVVVGISHMNPHNCRGARYRRDLQVHRRIRRNSGVVKRCSYLAVGVAHQGGREDVSARRVWRDLGALVELDGQGTGIYGAYHLPNGCGQGEGELHQVGYPGGGAGDVDVLG